MALFGLLDDHELSVTAFRPPDFDAPALRDAPDARFVAAPADGVAPEGFFSTTNLPTYVKLDGRWQRPREPRMDGVIVRTAESERAGAGRTLVVRELRRLVRGDRVAMGEAEDGSAGVYVHAGAFVEPRAREAFGFMQTPVSRERPVDYANLASMLLGERARGGYVVWVVGPAVVHARAREDLVWFVDNGFVQVLFGGNAVATHDLEGELFGTALGVTHAGDPAPGGHAMHMRAINAVRAAGGIAEAVTRGLAHGGIMHALVKRGVPYVLAGSIRDDGPLPGVLTDALAAQDAMRAHATKATMAVLVATALHAIATGNMLPSYVDADDDAGLTPLPTICVDQTEFVVGKLRDRGTHQAFGAVTNAQDFLHVLRRHVADALGVLPSRTEVG